MYRRVAPARPRKRVSTRRFKLTPVTPSPNVELLDGSVYPSRQLNANEIRLVELRPGIYGQPLQCDLVIFQLTESTDHEHPEWPEFCNFEAVSYTWGSNLEAHSIRLNDCYDLPVTDNLWYALNRLRWKYFSQQLWIDAIVINQMDDLEKSHQVQKMMTIYTCAKRTLVWLGEPTRPALSGRENQVHTPEFVQRQYELAPQRCMASRGCQNPFYPPPIIRYTIGLPFHLRDILTRRGDVETFQNLEAALASTSALWHTRTWIVQEFAASRDIQFVIGPSRIGHMDFDPDCNFYANFILDHMQMLSPHASDLRANLETLKQLRGIDDYSAPRIENFLNLIYHFRSFDLTDPRDRVYGMLGLLNKRHSRLIEVDYSKPAGLVFAQATYTEIMRSSRFNILTQIRLDRPDNPDLPSWAFECRVNGDEVPFPMYSIAKQPECEGPSTGKVSVALDATWRYLTVKGRVIATVSSVAEFGSKAASDTTNPKHYLDAALMQQNDHDGSLVEGHSRETPKPPERSRWHHPGEYTHAINDTLHRGGANARRALKFPECDLGETYHQETLGKIDKILLKPRRHSSLNASPMKSDIPQTLYAYAYTVSGRSAAFTTSAEAFTGFGPADIRKNDSVVLLRGCRLPVVLRPGKKESTWVFRGFVYVHRVVDYEYYDRLYKERGRIAEVYRDFRCKLFPEFLRGEEEDREFVLA